MRASDFGDIESGVFITKRKYPDHYFWMHDALFISEPVLDDLKQRGVMLVEMHYLNKDGIEETFLIPLPRWQKGLEWDNEGDKQRGIKMSELRDITRLMG